MEKKINPVGKTETRKVETCGDVAVMATANIEDKPTDWAVNGHVATGDIVETDVELIAMVEGLATY